jgi:hypothetical protein
MTKRLRGRGRREEAVVVDYEEDVDEVFGCVVVVSINALIR